MGYNTGSLQYVGTLQSPQKTHHQSTHTTEKQVSDPFIADSNPVVASSMLVFCAQNLQQEGQSLQQKGCFSVGCVDPRGFFLHRLQGPYISWDPVYLAICIHTGKLSEQIQMTGFVFSLLYKKM